MSGAASLLSCPGLGRGADEEGCLEKTRALPPAHTHTFQIKAFEELEEGYGEEEREGMEVLWNESFLPQST